MNNHNYKEQHTTTIKFTLTEELSIPILEPQLSPSENAVLMYLQLRQTKKVNAATREDIINDTYLSDRTIDGAIAKLKRLGKIQRIITNTLTKHVELTESA